MDFKTSAAHLPSEHPRRCQFGAKAPESRGNAGRVGQCKRFANRGVRFCEVHRHVYGNNKSGAKAMSRKRVDEVYKVIGRSLSDRLRELEEKDAMALQLRAELQLYRASCDEVVATYDRARDAYETMFEASEASPSDDKLALIASRLRTITQDAAHNVRSAMTGVADLAERAARIEGMAKGQFSSYAVRAMMGQVALLMYEVCGDENIAIARKFEELMGTRIKVNIENGSALGTSVTPDMIDSDVIQMDDTVPNVA